AFKQGGAAAQSLCIFRYPAIITFSLLCFACSAFAYNPYINAVAHTSVSRDLYKYTGQLCLHWLTSGSERLEGVKTTVSVGVAAGAAAAAAAVARKDVAMAVADVKALEVVATEAAVVVEAVRATILAVVAVLVTAPAMA
ncbi:hypothetical protein Vretifemale_11388, partial [Volvox reticuliferus]